MALVHDEACLFTLSLALPRFRDGRDEFGTPTILDDLLGGLASTIQLPMPVRLAIGPIQDWTFKEGILGRHASSDVYRNKA